MNSRQREVQHRQLLDEKRVLRELHQVYNKALADVNERIALLDARTDLENLSSIIYQRQYQEAIKKQLESALDTLTSNQFKIVSEFLTQSYENGFYGTLYDLHGQGIPLIFPLDHEQIKTAILVDTKLSTTLYEKLEIDVKKLKDSIRANLSRGLSASLGWNVIAQNLDVRMKIGRNNAIRIVRTEGHRILCESSYNAQITAKSKGADIVKQWDATLDNVTRPTHKHLDGQIRELDEDFEADGKTAKYPGAFGTPEEDCNCRCALLQRARWALDAAELEALKKRAEYFGLDKTKDFEEFREKYLHLPPNADTMDIESGNWQSLNFPQNYKTKAEAIKALSDKYNISFSDSRKYPIDTGILCDAVSWMDAFEKEYSEFVKLNPVKLPKLMVKAPSGMNNCSGYFKYYIQSGEPVELALNGQQHSNPKAFTEYLKRTVEHGWSVANATTRNTFVHEYGHYVSNSMCRMNSSRWEHDFLRECVEDYRKIHPEYTSPTFKGLFTEMNEVSKYGMSAEGECFAECFSEYFGGEKPREFAQIFGRKLNELLKGVK